MTNIAVNAPGEELLLMGNEAIARGAMEAGVQVCAAYPGTPSSEIMGSLSQLGSPEGIYVEWSTNEKVALEVVAAASFAGLRSLTAMKANGINVASDFLFNLNLTGSRGGLVVVVCDDPGALSSTNEEDSRAFAKIGDLPLLEPADFQEAKDMTRWAFEVSENLGLPCLIRSVTRVSHARGNVKLGEMPHERARARFDISRPLLSMPATKTHAILHEKLQKCRETFETSLFNFYQGPEKPELLIITAGAGWMYTQEALNHLKLEDRVGVLKLGTTWPLPINFLLGYLQKASRVLFLEEVDSFIEDNVKSLWAQRGQGDKTFLGKASGVIPEIGELNADLIIRALQLLLGVAYEPRPTEYAREALKAVNLYAPFREMGFCAGCPHRASYWVINNALALDGREGFTLGDIGCYGMGFLGTGYNQLKSLHAMGSGTGLAGGFGQLERFGLEQPVIAVCGDSTFYHAIIPALVNARYNGSNFLLIVLDNSATAMTGFQPHAGTGRTAMSTPAPVIDIAEVCRGLGIRVKVMDPFDLQSTINEVYQLLQDRSGVKVLIFRQECALVRAKGQKAHYRVWVDSNRCLGEDCGCNRFCSQVFKCPGLVWDPGKKKVRIDEAICNGCGVCTKICPQSAISGEVL
jgi:indolepyruvate ferredoxin oxidoreductase, alpha subunit